MHIPQKYLEKHVSALYKLCGKCTPYVESIFYLTTVSSHFLSTHVSY